MSTKSVALAPGDDVSREWRGCVTWVAEADGWYRPWRLPPKQVVTVRDDKLESRARMPAGVRAEFVTDARALALEVDGANEETSPVDVIVNDELWARRQVSDGDVSISLTCLGFGGQCHLDSVVARTIATLRADLISLCLGINVHGSASFGPRSWTPQICGSIQTVRDAHADVPIVVMSPNFTPGREREINAVGMTISDIRGGVADAVKVLQQLGDANIMYVDGRDLLREGEDVLRANDVHPNADGYHVMADRLAPLLNDAFERSQSRLV